MLRMLVVEVLRELGYATLEAEDGATALHLLEGTTRIDLLVADAARVRTPISG